jgi:hypothetical protein
VNFCPDDAIGDFVKISAQGPIQFLKFRPQGFIHKAFGNANHDRRVALSAIAIRFKIIAPQQAQQQFSRPKIGQGEAIFNGGVIAFQRAQPFANPVAGIGRSAALAGGLRPGIQRLNSAKFVT